MIVAPAQSRGKTAEGRGNRSGPPAYQSPSCATYLCHSQNMIILYLDHLVSWLLSFLSWVDQRQLRGRFQVQKLFYARLNLPCIDTIYSNEPFFFTIIIDDNITMILNIAILVNNININIM